jgi:hypothetical protein
LASGRSRADERGGEKEVVDGRAESGAEKSKARRAFGRRQGVSDKLIGYQDHHA